MRTTALTLLVVAFVFSVTVIVGGTSSWMQMANVVGVGAYVAPNPVNTALEYVAQREVELNEWETELTRREASQAAASRELTDILAVSVGAIAALLGLNYYMDWRRTKRIT